VDLHARSIECRRSKALECKADWHNQCVVFLKRLCTRRDKARELAWKIEATYINVLGGMSTDIIEMKVIIDLNKKALDRGT